MLTTDVAIGFLAFALFLAGLLAAFFFADFFLAAFFLADFLAAAFFFLTVFLFADFFIAFFFLEAFFFFADFFLPLRFAAISTSIMKVKQGTTHATVYHHRSSRDPAARCIRDIKPYRGSAAVLQITWASSLVHRILV
ncbi:MAG TPA: hypothetical protein VK460_01770 [Burkholderiales bacterium]|nr:hypothetical protein [Burkholderiales bacterium]